MKLDFEIPEVVCDRIIKKMDFVTEKVILYYNELDDDSDMSSLKGIEYVVIYEKGHKPKALEKEKPLLDECEKYLRDKVLKEFFSQWLVNTMLQHCPWTTTHTKSNYGFLTQK